LFQDFRPAADAGRLGRRHRARHAERSGQAAQDVLRRALARRADHGGNNFPFTSSTQMIPANQTQVYRGFPITRLAALRLSSMTKGSGFILT